MDKKLRQEMNEIFLDEQGRKGGQVHGPGDFDEPGNMVRWRLPEKQPGKMTDEEGAIGKKIKRRVFVRKKLGKRKGLNLYPDRTTRGYQI
jgi:hypothetical protein